MDRHASGHRRARCGLQATPEWGQIAQDWCPETRRASSGAPVEALFGIHGEAFRRVCSSAIGGNPGWECLDQCPYPIKRRAATLAQLFRGATPESETKAGRYDIRFGVISIQEPKIHGSKQSVKNLGPCFDRSRILADHI